MPLTSKKLQYRLWIIIGIASFMLIYTAFSPSFSQFWTKLGFPSGERVVIIIFLATILLSSLGVLLSVEKTSFLTRPSQGKKKTHDSIKEKSLHTGNSDVDDFNQHFDSVLKKLEEKLSQVDESAKSLAKANESLAQLVVKDGLTGLYNHSYIKERLLQELYRAERYKHSLSLLMIDLDDFKTLNDEYGHLTGDKALIDLAHLMGETIRPSDIPARYGGEEFLIILPETTSQSAISIAERIQEKVNSYAFEINSSKKETFQITVSIGLCTYPDFEGSAEDLIHLADSALYKAKKAGKNRIETFKK